MSVIFDFYLEGINLGCSWARVYTAVVVHTKHLQAVFLLQCVQASSRLNKTPPMGAPNAAYKHTHALHL